MEELNLSFRCNLKVLASLSKLRRLAVLVSQPNYLYLESVIQSHLQHVELVAVLEKLSALSFRVPAVLPKFVGKTFFVFRNSFALGGLKQYAHLIAPYLDPADDVDILCTLAADPSCPEELFLFFIKRGFSVNAL